MEAAGLCYQAGIHAANHALLAVTPLFLKTDPGDIETEHTFPYQVWLWLMCVYEGMFVGPETACTRTVPSVDTQTHTHIHTHPTQTEPPPAAAAPGVRQASGGHRRRRVTLQVSDLRKEGRSVVSFVLGMEGWTVCWSHTAPTHTAPTPTSTPSISNPPTQQLRGGRRDQGPGARPRLPL